MTTTSLDALRAYTQGMELNSEGKYREADLFLERAVALDPNFVTAYSSLRIINTSLGNDDAARKYATKAFELRDRTSERERLRVTAAYQVTVLRNIEKAAETYDLYSRTYPKDYVSWNGLAIAQRDLGRLQESLRGFQEVIRLRPMPINLNNLGAAYLLNEQFDEAKSILRKAIEEKREVGGMHYTLYEIAFINGDREAMQQELDALKVPSSSRPPAADLIFLGKLNDSRKRDGAVSARTELLFGFGQEAETRAKEAFRQNRMSREEAITAAMAGEADGIQTLQQASREFPEDTFLNLMNLPTAVAAFELRAGNAAKAVQALQPAARFEPAPGTLLAIYVRGQAYLQLKSGARAAAEFQKILSHRGIALRSVLVPLSYAGLAQSFVLAGDLAKARKAYKDFFAVWKEADPDIPILVQAKAEYARLGS